MTTDYMRHVSNSEAAAKNEDWRTAFREANLALRANAAMIGVVLQTQSQIMDGVREIRQTYSMSSVLGLLTPKENNDGPDPGASSNG